MGLEDIVDETKEEVKKVDDEEIKNYQDRVEKLSEIVVKQDKRIEDLEEQIHNLEMTLSSIETVQDNIVKDFTEMVGDEDQGSSGFLEGEENNGDHSSKWKPS